MNKLIIPAILAATVMVAAAFAVMPVQKASTVHTTILAALGSGAKIREVFLDTNGAANGNKSPITVDVLVHKGDGSAITDASFSATSPAGPSKGNALTTVVTDSGNGAYRVTITPANNWGTGRSDIVITATSASSGASDTALIVAALP